MKGVDINFLFCYQRTLVTAVITLTDKQILEQTLKFFIFSQNYLE
jgi:hypothetical protein